MGRMVFVSLPFAYNYRCPIQSLWRRCSRYSTNLTIGSQDLDLSSVTSLDWLGCGRYSLFEWMAVYFYSGDGIDGFAGTSMIWGCTYTTSSANPIIVSSEEAHVPLDPFPVAYCVPSLFVGSFSMTSSPITFYALSLVESSQSWPRYIHCSWVGSSHLMNRV